MVDVPGAGGISGGLMEQILVVEDDDRLRNVLTRLLDTAGYRAQAVGSGADALRACLTHDVALVLLDLNLPDIPGDDLLSMLLVQKPGVPVVVLSSVTEVRRRVAMLESGAVDFVQKPFVNAELLARIRLRMDLARGGNEPRRPPRLPIDDRVTLDLQRRELVMGSTRTPLSAREFALLTHLLERRGRVCTRQELLADVWGMQFDPGTNVVDVCVRRLRTKLAGAQIETVRNVGYRIIAS